MATFQTFNQFDHKFKVSGFGGECNACPVFALFTAKKFMDNGSVSKEQHEKNLEAAIMNYVVSEHSKELPKYLSFTELVQFTGGEFSDGNIAAATPEIINNPEFGGYEMFFKPNDSTQNYCIIFLKNSNFIIVLVKHNADGSKLFCIRDCHETEQFNFESFDALTVHMSVKYQFNELTVVDGVLIEEYGNIEYLQIDKQFPIIILDITLYDDEDKTEIEDDNVILHFDPEKFTEEELHQLGMSSNKTNIMDALKYSPTSSTTTTDSSILSLDEMMAMQLQYGDDAY